jgi:hypothetical protein
MSYSPSLADAWRQAGAYIGGIFRGLRPSHFGIG